MKVQSIHLRFVNGWLDMHGATRLPFPLVVHEPNVYFSLHETFSGCWNFSWRQWPVYPAI